MKRLSPHIFFIFCIFLAFAISGCCNKAPGPAAITSLMQQQIKSDSPIALHHLPRFYIKESTLPYNRIGTPTARAGEKDKPQIVVDGAESTLYYEKISFHTAKGSYTNLVYRVHFEKVPLGLNSLNLTAGNNPGLLIIYTLDAGKRVVLITTVHTCGCYLAFIPTTALAKDAYPEKWHSARQDVFGYSLPGRIGATGEDSDIGYQFTIESETHRISDVVLWSESNTQELHQIPLRLVPMADLYKLPYQNDSVSFFESEGSREGYVKNNTKILERLLISWWAFDLHVGEDKAFGISDTSDIPFYTSLKFWRRDDSDMKDFPTFLSYWGWQM